jgi:hypothetical protein
MAGIILDFVDRKTYQLVWRGCATEACDKIANLKSQLSGEITKLLKKNPSDPAKKHAQS